MTSQGQFEHSYSPHRRPGFARPEPPITRSLIEVAATRPKECER
jgi:hypothetical protein